MTQPKTDLIERIRRGAQLAEERRERELTEEELAEIAGGLVRKEDDLVLRGGTAGIIPPLPKDVLF